MAINGHVGPFGTFGQAQFGDSNPSAGPAFWYQGDMLLDPRGPFTYQPGQREDQGVYGWPTSNCITLIDQAPSTASATNIAAAQVPVAGTPMTLVSVSGGGITVGCTVQNAKTGVNVTGLLGIDVAAARTFTGVFSNGSAKITWSAAPGALGIQIGDQVTLTTSGTLPTGFATSTIYYVVAVGGSATIGSGAFMLSATPGGTPISAGSAGSGTQTVNVTAPNTYDNNPATPFQPQVVFGQGGAGNGGPIRFWNPNWAISRTLILSSTGNDTSATFTINGYDVYGYPLTQTVTGAGAGLTVSTTKAFKYITSVVPAGTLSGSNVSVGTNDNFGIPLRTDWAVYLDVYWNNALVIPASIVFVPADINTPSATTGDVRGTLTAAATSDGTKRLQVFWTGEPADMNTTVGLLGQTQF